MSFATLTPLAFIHQIGLPGLIAILVVALIVFGRRLPEVARSLGKGIVEFKKGVRGIEDEVEDSVHHAEIEGEKRSSSSSNASSAPTAASRSED